jgi:hypothetical protein
VHSAKIEKRTSLMCPQKDLLPNLRLTYNSILDVGKDLVKPALYHFWGGVNECLKRKKKLKTTRVGTKKETTGSNSYCFFPLGEKDFVLCLPFS